MSNEFVGEERNYRYAIYYAPSRDGELWKNGTTWLGRDPITQETLPQPSVPGISQEQIRALTSQPRRYGFHATLKAPFALAHSTSLSDLKDAVRRICQNTEVFPMPRLVVKLHNSTLSLVVAQRGHSDQINTLCKNCVTDLHSLAAPLPESEIARQRRKSVLSDIQDKYLLEWGYPHVFDQFEFHMTVTNKLKGTSEATQHALKTMAEILLLPEENPLQESFLFDQIAIFAEPTEGSDFVLVESFKLGA